MSIIERAAKAAQGAVQSVLMKAVELAPDRAIPGGIPDPLIRKQHGQIGRPVSRIDGPLKVAGAARFAAEYAPDGMAYAAVLFGTIPKGRIARLATTEAERAPGVVLVMTHHNMPRLKPMPRFMDAAKAAGGDNLPVLQDDRIHWNGQPVAVVLADSQEQADHAKSLIRVEYEAEPAITGFAEARARDTSPGTFQGEPLLVEVGDAPAALAAAAHKVDVTYTTPRHTHAAIEPHAATVLWEGDSLRVHDATQAVGHTAWSLATMFGIKEDQVHVSSPYVGGGFGSKTLWQHQVLGAAASRLSGRPVRIALSREGVFRLVGGRSLTEQRVAIGANADGKFTAILHTGTTAMSPHSAIPEAFIVGTKSTYGAETFKLDVEVAQVDMLANTFMRAPGEAVGTVGLECAIDELAHEMGVDPIDLRLRNEPETDPLLGTPWSLRNLEQAYRMGAERFGWNGRQAPGNRREGEWLVGMGVATGTYPYNRMPGGAARITLDAAGAARVDIAAHEMGMGTATAQAQVAADRLGLSLDDVTLNYGDSTLPGVVLAGGSQQTAAIGAAVMAANDKLKAELLKLAGNDSPLAGLSTDEVEGGDGGLASLEDPTRRESYASILARAQRAEVSVEAEASKPTEAQHWSMHSFSAVFAEVRVNAVTGETRVSRLLGSFDCGRILNPKTAASQFRGGMIMGLGLALMEETEFDERKGRVMNPSLAEYHVPVHLDVPAIDVIWTDIPDPHAPMGAHGIGEIGITGTGAAICNAVFNATGKRVRDLPLTLDKLL
jgi:xanthine dehydrogenase YagR molybdenum-binding subunit